MNPDGGAEPQSQPGSDKDGDSNVIVVEAQQLVALPEQKKLSSTVIGDGSFEEMMKERFRSRKEREGQSLSQVKIQLASAERALVAEIQRRIQSTHAIEKSCAEKVQMMERNFKRILNERSLRMEERLASAQQKAEELEARLEEEKEAVPKDMEARGKELREMLDSYQKELAKDRKDRLMREGRLLKQMDDHYSEIFDTIEKESAERKIFSDGLQARIDDNERLRSQHEYELQSKVQKEMDELRGMIDTEKQERKQGDDEIIMALNHYTQQLQNSLSVISS